ncbi:hypothetical protein V1509DRAFT_630452 [Lipomyces kononenkoae]
MSIPNRQTKSNRIWLYAGNEGVTHSTSSNRDAFAMPNVSKRAKSRSSIAIADLINHSATIPSPSYVPVPDPPASVVSLNTGRSLPVENYVLQIRQQPVCCKPVVSSEEDYKTVDPMPIVQLTILDGDPHREWLQFPLFMCVSLYDPVLNTPVLRPLEQTIERGFVSLLHRVRNQSGCENGYFFFENLGIKLEGQFCLQFNLFQVLNGAQFKFIKSTLSDVVTVYSSKQLPVNFRSEIMTHIFADRSDDQAATSRQGACSPTAALSVHAKRACPVPSTAKLPKAEYAMGMNMNQTWDANDASRCQRKSSLPSSVSTSSYLSANQSSCASNGRSRTRGQRMSDLKRRGDGARGNERTNSYCDRPSRYMFLRLSYTPRQEYQCCTSSRQRRPLFERHDEHDFLTISDTNADRPLSLCHLHQSEPPQTPCYCSRVPKFDHGSTSSEADSSGCWTCIIPDYISPSYALTPPRPRTASIIEYHRQQLQWIRQQLAQRHGNAVLGNWFAAVNAADCTTSRI